MTVVCDTGMLLLKLSTRASALPRSITGELVLKLDNRSPTDASGGILGSGIQQRVSQEELPFPHWGPGRATGPHTSKEE